VDRHRQEELERSAYPNRPEGKPSWTNTWHLEVEFSTFQAIIRIKSSPHTRYNVWADRLRERPGGASSGIQRHVQGGRRGTGRYRVDIPSEGKDRMDNGNRRRACYCNGVVGSVREFGTLDGERKIELTLKGYLGVTSGL